MKLVVDSEWLDEFLTLHRPNFDCLDISCEGSTCLECCIEDDIIPIRPLTPAEANGERMLDMLTELNDMSCHFPDFMFEGTEDEDDGENAEPSVVDRLEIILSEIAKEQK